MMQFLLPILGGMTAYYIYCFFKSKPKAKSLEDLTRPYVAAEFLRHKAFEKYIFDKNPELELNQKFQDSIKEYRQKYPPQEDSLRNLA